MCWWDNIDGKYVGALFVVRMGEDEVMGEWEGFYGCDFPQPREWPSATGTCTFTILFVVFYLTLFVTSFEGTFAMILSADIGDFPWRATSEW